MAKISLSIVYCCRHWHRPHCNCLLTSLFVDNYFLGYIYFLILFVILCLFTGVGGGGVHVTNTHVAIGRSQVMWGPLLPSP